MPADRLIHVAGDHCLDWLLLPVPRRIADGLAAPLHNWQLQDGMRCVSRPGGAWLVAELAAQACGQPVLQAAAPPGGDNWSSLGAVRSWIELAPFDGRWRIDRFRGYWGMGDGAHEPFAHLSTGAAGVLVLDDAGNGFRDTPAAWPEALRHAGKNGPLIVWKLARPFAGAHASGALARHLLDHHAERTVLLLDVEDLRAQGASISRRLSWERTVHDTLQVLNDDPRFAHLARVAQVVVRLGLEGALHLVRHDGLHVEVNLSFMPEAVEDGLRESTRGTLMGFGSAMAAALAAGLAAAQSLEPAAVCARVRQGLRASQRLLQAGLGAADGEPALPAGLFDADRPGEAALVQLPVAPALGSTAQSSLLDYLRGRSREILADEILQFGARRCAPQVPMARFGKLETIDRSEIEAFRGVANLVHEYLALPRPARPLCIAVFGPPGSGKSFGVTEVARSMGDLERLEFNLAQFDDARQLIAAFHAVRDAVVRGRVPLVFFDEFDATVDGQPLYWLRHLLAPMQDGRFLDGESAHLIGRAIFVFAGGTRPGYRAFTQPPARSSAAERDSFWREFRLAKGPDFVSRLRGYIDVRGTDTGHPDDSNAVVRRAMLLRSLLARIAPALFDAAGTLRMDAGVRRAFLATPRFRHGARSLEAILDMSQLSGRENFERSALPTATQLDVHVDGLRFLAAMNQDVALHAQREALARAIHDRFLAVQRNQKPATDPSMQPWENLPEVYRNSCRGQAGDITNKLEAVGCTFVPALGEGPRPFAFDPDEIELLAQGEHERWIAERRASGYAFGPRLDDVLKTHPCLIPWDDLSEEERDKDRESALALPGLLEQAGFRVQRRQ